MSLSVINKRILDLLQKDSTQTASEIGNQVGLTAAPCWRRIQKLEKEGFIKRRVALLDREKLNVGVTVFVAVRTSRHTQEWLQEFKEGIQQIPEIVESHRLGGEIDYLLRVVVPDIESFDRVYKKLIGIAEFSDISSSFSMEELKSTTTLPLDYV